MRCLLATLAFGFAAMVMPATAQGPATPIFVLTPSGQIASSTLNAPGTTDTPVAITGVTAGQTLVSIDVRPQNQALYALGVDAVADTAQLYRISPQTGAAVALGAAFGLTTDGTTVVDFPTSGFDIDFNPAVDRLRVMTTSGLNFRINPNNGAPVDSNMNAGDGINPDGAVNGLTTSVSATAYTNSQPNNGGITTQYTLDAATDSLYIQTPPNNGTQTAGLVITVNGSPLDFFAVSGFDIAPGVNAGAANQAVTTGSGYAVLTTTSPRLYQIDLTTGAATEVANFAPRSFAINPGLGATIGLVPGTPGSLVRFSTLSPSTTTSVNLGATNGSEIIVSIDQRPATGQLYGLGIDSTNNTGTIYLIDPQLGSLTAIGTPGGIAYVDTMGNPIDFPDLSAGWEIDFNPTVDRVRVVTGIGLNFRINQTNGTPVDNNATPADGVNPDGMINGATTSVHATAYTNSFQGTTVTTQYTLDAVTNSLYIQNPPNNGTQTVAVPVTLSGNPLDFTNAVGFDILSNVTVATSNIPAVGVGYFAATVGGTAGLYRIDLTTGASENLGTLPAGLSGLAVLSVSTTATVINPTVTELTATGATLSATVATDGGGPILSRGIVYALTSAQATPAIGDSGVTDVIVPGTTGLISTSITGLTTGSSYSFRAYAVNEAGITYSAVASFTPPVLIEPEFPDSVVGQEFEFTLGLATGTTVTAKGLPAGLKLNGKTGVISGRFSTPGVYQVLLTAKGPGGITTSYISTFIVQALPKAAVGTFIGLISPDLILNEGTGGRVDLTTTSQGSYTLKVTQLTKTTTVKGFLTTAVETIPSLTANLADGSVITLDLIADDLLDGLYTVDEDSVAITGWRRTFDKVLNPAAAEMGYVGVALEIDSADLDNPDVPQGTGFAGITIGVDGSVKYTGKAADGSALTGTGFLGPNGETLIYVPLYKKLGSIAGIITQNLDPAGKYAENSYTGTVFYAKPATTGVLYPEPVSLVPLNVEGKYLATTTKGLVLGLPSGNDPSTLDFSGAGIEAAALNPDLTDSVTLPRPGLKILFPTPGSAQNLARTTVALSSSTGSLTGGFTLQDGALKRSVKYQGMIIRRMDGATTANGYFLLPQLPVGNESIKTTPILSGRVDLRP